MYHSSFNDVTLSTDLCTKEVNTNANADRDDDAVNKSIIDFYADRFKNQRIQNALDDVNNLMDLFVNLLSKNRTCTARKP